MLLKFLRKKMIGDDLLLGDIHVISRNVTNKLKTNYNYINHVF